MAISSFGKHFLLTTLVWCLEVTMASASDMPQLAYELKPRASQAELGKPFFVDYFVKNNGPNTILLCKCQQRGEIIFGKLDKNNEAPLFIDRFKTTEPPKDENFITIPPFSAVKFSWGGFGEEYFSSPGDWVLQIRDRFTAVSSPAGDMSWQGTIESPMVRVTVSKVP